MKVPFLDLYQIEKIILKMRMIPRFGTGQRVRQKFFNLLIMNALVMFLKKLHSGWHSNRNHVCNSKP